MDSESTKFRPSVFNVSDWRLNYITGIWFYFPLAIYYIGI